MKKLSETFHCYFIDQLGFGSSSKVNCFEFDRYDAEETDLYHSGWIEAWRIAVGNITNFYLIGHNYGGYAAGLYASIHPKHIAGLFLISPAGTEHVPDDYDYYTIAFEKDGPPPAEEAER
mmetsp:Transcript_15529/g.10900  ORF Transcript_15529/g.10900 Transcript_15529/m.10900 type:complete len:120 (-) Transcript_15529:866-1225(-)